MSKLCAKGAARERACKRLLTRTSLAKTSRATTLNRKCNGCHFSKCSSQCCGVIFVLNNSKVVMIKMSFTLISWLLIVLTITSSPVYTLLIRRSGDKRYSAACMQAKQGSCVSRPLESLLCSQLVFFDLARDTCKVKRGTWKSLARAGNDSKAFTLPVIPTYMFFIWSLIQ